ncbi:hypothetical protein [Rhizobium sp. SAFR-030]|uniref:hypothetical protein n=1 Tax=Rhizobium sp. SAFR-030 TaxID=3387277 RepID=UPI003F80318F
MTSTTAGSGTSGRTKRLSLSPAASVLLFGGLCAALLALPGVTVATKSLDELFLIFDQIHRIASGQQPGVDFPAMLGPLTAFVPALVYRWTGSFGLAMPLSMAGFVLLTAAIASHVLATRLRPFLAVSFAGFLLLILAAPMSLGDGVTALSFAKFDIRIGWVALALLVVLYLRPTADRPRTEALDVMSAVLLTLALLYTRVPYGIVAVALLVLLLTDRRQWRVAAPALMVIIAVVVALHLGSGVASAYHRESWRLLTENGLLAGSLWSFFQRGMTHLTDFLLLGILAGLTLWMRRSPRDLSFFLLCAIGGLIILSHNSNQPWGIISMHAAAVVAAELLLRRMDEQPAINQGQMVNASGVKLFFMAFVLPTSLHCAMALMLHAAVATTRAGEAVSLPRIDRVRLADLWTTDSFRGQTWYVGLQTQAVELLRQSKQPLGRYLVLGEANIASTALDLAPPQGAPDLRWSTLMSEQPPMEPAERLAAIDTVLLRKTGESGEGLQQRTLSFLRDNFSAVGEAKDWILFQRRPSADAPPAPGLAPG